MKFQEEDFGTLQERIDAERNAARASDARIEGDDLRLQLPGGGVVLVPIRRVRSLKTLSAEQLADLRLSDGGRVLLWPHVGVSIDVEGLLEAVTGMQSLKTAQRKGGAARSEAKTTASRANGAKGGRPRKVAA